MMGVCCVGIAGATVLSDAHAIQNVLDLVNYATTDPNAAATEMRSISDRTIVRDIGAWSPTQFAAKNASLPVVLAHGMGDSCFNSGFKSVTAAVASKLGVYATCIPTGSNAISDTINGFLMNMDKSVDVFAAKVRADPKLTGGFYAMGLSQGNNLIRGYIQKYNDPPVKSFLSICGINAGVAAFPQCAPSIPVLGKVCLALNSLLGDLAYNALVQGILMQANYFRDPAKLSSPAYMQHSQVRDGDLIEPTLASLPPAPFADGSTHLILVSDQLAQWNGEGVTPAANMSQQRANWAKTAAFVWVRGTLDTVVWPNIGEQWGAVSADYPKNLSSVPMAQTKWYTTDAFGLKTADDAGKNFFESFAGQHIRFTEPELYGWLDKYFV